MSRLNQKRILVTAAAAGIGRAIAEAFLREGAEVWATDIDTAGLADLQEQNPSIKTRHLDVLDAGAVQRFAEEMGHIDVLFNCAGFVANGAILECDEDSWNFSFELNVKVMYRMIKAFLPAMLEKQSGNIVNMASSAGLVGQAYTAAYCATKAAVVNLSKSLATEFASRSVRVNAICPGAVDTELAKNVVIPEDVDMKLFAKMLPLLERAQPEEIAAAIAYIASSEARFVTGAALSIAGGQVARCVNEFKRRSVVHW